MNEYIDNQAKKAKFLGVSLQQPAILEWTTIKVLIEGSL